MRFALLLAVTLALPVLAAEPSYRALKDFVVGCDNVKRCQAQGIPAAPASGNPLVLELWRDAGPDGKGTLALEANVKFAPRELRLDGKPAQALSALPWREDDGDAECAWRLEDAAAITRFLDAVRNATRIEVGQGEDQAALSLSGLSATLLFIDDAQGRLDTQTAWLRRSSKPAQAVPPAPAVPALPPAPKAEKALTDAQAKALSARVRKQQAKALHAEACETDSAPEDQAFALDARDALVLLGCATAAYSTSALAFRVPRSGHGAGERLVLPVPRLSSKDPGSLGVFSDADFDPATATLSQSAKGRGLADCGSSASWRFDGKTFALAGYAFLDRCGGVAPGDWIPLWRTR